MTEMEKFNEDYGYMRKLLLRGMCTVNDARSWLKSRGERFEKSFLQETEELMQKRYSGNADREEKHINQVLKHLKGDDD